MGCDLMNYTSVLGCLSVVTLIYVFLFAECCQVVIEDAAEVQINITSVEVNTKLVCIGYH